MKIIIIGAGWYGLHIAYKNQYKHEIIVLEKSDDIFNGSSYHNQNRLHLGFHYPRSYDTRKLCKNSFDLFMEDYKDLAIDIENNFYLISKNSILDYGTYKTIYDHELYNYDTIDVDENIFMKSSVQGKIIKVHEKLISHKLAKQFFKEKLSNTQVYLNYEVFNDDIKFDDDKVIIKNDFICDILLDCTYGQLNYNHINKDAYIYEKTISHVYKKQLDISFDCVTVMDGNFPSLYLRDHDDKTYSLTHVVYTPIIKSNNINDIINYNLDDSDIIINRSNMESDIIKYIPDFKKYFYHVSHYFGYKLKKIALSDDRTCSINRTNNIISVNGGKISGIYEFEDYFNNFIIKQK